uniref:Uncharacterized protein n=1 Tax=Heliothis virescens TaxID=7102 RepID=A0A2A4J3U5_HELVI
MECCYPPDCGECTVTPMLVAPNCVPKYCDEEPPTCYPCLPRCQKPMYVCYDQKPTRPKTPRCQAYERESCPRHASCCSPRPPRHEPCSAPEPSCEPCCPPPCKPVKTKYIIPCYRYEDGRITNQPTVLTRRACEVACGTRARRKPFVVSSYAADPYNEIRRYHSEDERGNCCFHFERNKPQCNPCASLCQPCVSCPECQYVDCVYAHPATDSSGCYYCK